MNQFVILKGIRLCEAHMTFVTLVWFFSSVGTKVTLQFEGIRRSICAVATLNNKYIIYYKLLNYL